MIPISFGTTIDNDRTGGFQTRLPPHFTGGSPVCVDVFMGPPGTFAAVFLFVRHIRAGVIWGNWVPAGDAAKKPRRV